MSEQPRLTLGALRKEFQSRNWHRKATGAVVRELIIHSAFAFYGAVIALQAESQLMFYIGAIISAFGTLGVSTNTHTSTHLATSDSKRLNNILASYGYPMFVGMGRTYWHRSHVEVHHGNPNIHGVDADHDFLPYFVVAQPELEGKRGGWRTYYSKVQFWVFPFVVWLNAYTRQVNSWVIVFQALRKNPRSKPHLLDLALLTSHFLLWIGIPALATDLPTALWFYFVRVTILGYIVYAVLAPAHYVPEAVFIHKDGRPSDPVLLQTATTVNFRTGPLGRLLCSGLEYQIEHHLFPGYSHVHYAKMSPYVREFCRQNGYPYRTLGWAEAVWKTTDMLRRPKPVQPTVERSAPQPPQAV